MEVKESLLIDFMAEKERIVDLINHDNYTKADEDDSYNDMLDRIDETYRRKDGGHDFSLDLFDLYEIIGIMKKDTSLVDMYGDVVSYLMQ